MTNAELESLLASERIAREQEQLARETAQQLSVDYAAAWEKEKAARVEAEREMGVAHAFRDKHLDSLRACMEKREAQVAALENVRALAAQAKVYGWKPDHADHMLRFCAEAGVVSSPLRAALGAEPGDAALTQKEGQGAPAVEAGHAPSAHPIDSTRSAK